MNRNLILIAATFIGIIATILLGNIITIGDKLGELTHAYVECAFYIIIILLTFLYIVRPVLKTHRSPEIPALSINNNWKSAQLYDFAKKLANNCAYISDSKQRKEHQKKFLKEIRTAQTNNLREIISKEIALRLDGDKSLNVLGINNRIKEWAKTVFMVTAISQNGKLDAISVLIMNYKMISDIVLASGFRPTKPQMFKLYITVLTTALITYCTSQVFTDMKDIRPFESNDNDLTDNAEIDTENMSNGILELIKNIRIPGVVVGPIIDGCLNAIMTLRIGYVTRSYLVDGVNAFTGIKNKRKIKRQAIKEALSSISSVVSSGSSVLGKGISSVLQTILNKK